MTRAPRTLVVSNIAIGDDTFDADVGTWNVSRAQRDCAAGKYQLYVHDVEEVYQNNKQVTVNAAKVAAMIADPNRLFAAPPLIFVSENERIWLIDGHHRLRALRALSVREFCAFVIEEHDAEPYRVYFNGRRIAPWMGTHKGARK